uniref:Uncharacterized protein n=1 Tax=Romanomermis culicivorax TaxID=13658 RepID=A0A915KS82_ROMCU
MLNERGTAQRPSARPSDEIQRLQWEMARLMAHVVGLMAQPSAPPLRNSMPSQTPSPSTCIQNAADRPSGAHSQMCRAQHPDSAGPSTATATGASRCYFC